jgi:general stress protein YciG
LAFELWQAVYRQALRDAQRRGGVRTGSRFSEFLELKLNVGRHVGQTAATIASQSAQHLMVNSRPEILL